MSPLPKALPNDGFLDMVIFKKTDTLKALQVMPSYLNGKYFKYPELFSYKKINKISIESDSPLLVNLDGEVFFDTTVNVEIIPAAVKFVAVNGLCYRGGGGYYKRAVLDRLTPLIKNHEKVNKKNSN
jgi:diacylglycerol kinase family enzyme